MIDILTGNMYEGFRKGIINEKKFTKQDFFTINYDTILFIDHRIKKLIDSFL